MDDRGVRDRQAHRPPEQRDHGEPIGQCAHGCGLAERRNPGPDAALALPVADRETGQHQQQQAQREGFQAPQLSAARIVGRRHAGSLTGTA